MCKEIEEASKDTEYFTCPFCKDEGYDLPGLKCHFTWCEAYKNTEEWELMFHG